MRPRLYDNEVLFLLDLLKETEASVKRQHQNLIEEAEHRRLNDYALKQKFLYQDSMCVKEWKQNHVRLQALDYNWIPFYSKKLVVLRGLIVRLEKMLTHKRGRYAFSSSLMWTYLHQICPKKEIKTQVSTVT